MSFIVKGNNYKYTVATPRYITNTYVIPEGIQPALYKLAEQDVPLLTLRARRITPQPVSLRNVCTLSYTVTLNLRHPGWR